MVYFPTLFIILFLLKSFTFSKLHKVHDFKVIALDSSQFITRIFLQQILLFISTIFLLRYFSLPIVMIIVATIFGLSHFYIFLKHRVIDGVILVMSGFLGGLVFVCLYNRFYLYGLVSSFLIHILYHSILDVVFMYKWGKSMKMFKR